MAARPIELTLHLVPRSRYDAIDVGDRVREEFGDVLAPFRRAAYCSFHTTAGYLDQSLAARLRGRDRLDPFIKVFQGLFPQGAPYRHDRLEERVELSDDQRRTEPRNGDSHLAFIASGLRNCVTYTFRTSEPVYFMDLDGVHDGVARRRQTSVIAYDEAMVVDRVRLDVPVSRHPIDSVNLADPRFGVIATAEDLHRRHGVESGRIDISLASGEREAAVTVNEFETLLMRHDLAEVLADPFRFLARQGRRMLREPRTIPAKSWGYAKYDVVQVVNELMDALRISESAVERLVAKFMAVPAARLLRLKRSVSLLVSETRRGIVRGTYQSPILIQWNQSPRRQRTIEVTLTRFC